MLSKLGATKRRLSHFLTKARFPNIVLDIESFHYPWICRSNIDSSERRSYISSRVEKTSGISGVGFVHAVHNWRCRCA